MTKTTNPEQEDADIIGKRFKVVQCEAREHGDNEGCVCHLIGKEVTISMRYNSPFCGTCSFHLRGRKQRVRRSEIGLPDTFQ